MQKQAEMELTDLNFDGNFYQKGMLKRVPSIENFLKIFDFNKNVRKNEGKPKIKFQMKVLKKIIYIFVKVIVILDK